MEKACKWHSEVIKNKKIVSVDCSECPLIGSLSNLECLKNLSDIIINQAPDQFILKKNFYKIYDKTELDNAKKIMNLQKKIAKHLRGTELCEECSKKVLPVAGDPISFFINSQYACEKCSKKISGIMRELKDSELIKLSLQIGNVKTTYRRLLDPKLVPSLISSFIDREMPKTKILDSYSVEDIKIKVHDIPNRPDKYYFVTYPEFDLNNTELKSIQGAFEKLCQIESSPDLLKAEFQKIASELNNKKLKTILMRHTLGYGLIEPLLKDENLQDIYVDSGSKFVHVVHAKWGECITNIWLSKDEIDKITTRLRAISGRPFDASSPVLHTELQDLGIRVCAICEPSTYSGTGFAFRRRKTDPWNLVEFIKYKMLNPEAAGLLSFLMDGSTSILIVGARGSGKTSLLTSLLIELNQNNRIITIEDTPEVPIDQLRNLGFKIEHLKTEAFAKGYELSAEDALRTSLRLGESILILGEVRGPEAKALFEAMRVGAVGNVVIGTIHGSGPYDVWDRITNDLGVPSTSFKATDIIVTTGTIRKADSTEKERRVLKITEVRKDWKDEPEFYDLMVYNRKLDKLILNDIWKSQIIKKIMETKGLNRKQVKENIETRIKIRKDLLKIFKNKAITSEIIVKTNNKFINIIKEQVSKGMLNYKSAYKEISKWLKSL